MGWDLLFGNYLTPRAGAYEDFIRNGSFAVEIEEETDLGEFPVFQKFGKLYRIEGMEEAILYLCTWFAEYERFSDGYDGFFSLRDGKVEKLKIKTKEGTFWQGEVPASCMIRRRAKGDWGWKTICMMVTADTVGMTCVSLSPWEME